MLSILLALAVDNWTESRRHQRLAQQSLEIFEREIRQTLAVVEGNAPYHTGLRSVVAEAIAHPSSRAVATRSRNRPAILRPPRPSRSYGRDSQLQIGVAGTTAHASDC